MTNKEQSEDETSRKHFRIKPIGFIRSDLKCREDAPRQGREGAPNALIELLPSYTSAFECEPAMKSLSSVGYIAPGET